MTPTARPSTSPGLAVNTATQDALQSLLANGTASSGTVTSVTADGLKLALAVVRPSNGTHNGTTASYAVALPDSSTTVALALPSSLSGGAVAVVVTTVEVEASRFSSFGSSGGNGSSNSSATRPTVALPSPQLVSSVVSIQVSQLSSNGSLTATTVPYFETSVSVCLWQPPFGAEGSSGSSAIDEAAAVVRQIAGDRVVDTVPIASTAADETPPCLFNGSNSSTLAFLLSYLIAALFAGVLDLMLDRFQEVLKAKEATVTLRDRRRVGRVADVAIETDAVPAVKTDRKEREQLAVREYPGAAVHSQRDQHRCLSKDKPSQPLNAGYSGLGTAKTLND
eukprot:gene15802-biopygen7113